MLNVRPTVHIYLGTIALPPRILRSIGNSIGHSLLSRTYYGTKKIVDISIVSIMSYQASSIIALIGALSLHNSFYLRSNTPLVCPENKWRKNVSALLRKHESL